MFELRHTSGFCELGVAKEHLDGERHFVDDALTGSVVAAEQFEIGEQVVLPVSVLVVNRLLGAKLAADVLLHHVPVLEDFVRRGFSNTGNHQLDVALPVDTARNLLVGVVGAVAQTTKQGAACGTAQAFTAVDGSSRSPLDGHHLPALDTSVVPSFGRQPSSETSAFGRAVHWLFAPFLDVRSDERRLHEKRFAALLASKLSGNYLRSQPTVNRFVVVFAFSCAALLRGISGFNAKTNSAVFANLINRHLVFSFVGATTSVTQAAVCVNRSI